METGAPIQVQAEQDLQVLRDKRAVQKDIATRKKQYQDQISSLQARIQTYQLQQDQLSQLNKQLEELNRELNDMKAKQEQINLNQLKPIQAKLMAKTAQLPDLMKVATAADLTALGQGLINYVQQYTEAKHDFEAFTQMLQGLGSDVEIVTDMKTELDGRIDDRVQGMLSGRIRTGLHQDNHEVHDAGAAKMNQQYRVVKNQQDQLLQQHTDLVKILAHPELLTEIQGFQIKITEINQELIQCAADINDINKEKKLHQAEATRIEHNMEDHFNVADVNDEINELYRLHDELVVDDELDDKIERAQNKYKQIKTSQQQFIKEMSALDGTLRTLVAESDKLSARLKGFVTEGQQDLQVLMPYAPTNVKLTTVSEAIDFVAANRAEVRNNQYAEISDRVGRLIHRNDSNGVDLNALDVLFEERGHSTEASAMRQQRSLAVHNMTIVAFDLNHALDLLKEDQHNVQRALDAKKLGNDTAHTTYLQAASHLITDQYRLIESYNQMLSKGVNRDQSIRLKITLTPAEVNEDVIKEARDAHLQTQPALQAEIEKRLNKLANDTTIIDDDDFIQKAIELLDTRRWSTFKVLIKRRQNDEDNYEEVDDKFVQSGGSGAEKAQAMVLPLLLVPKMILQRATQKDTPYLVMFDEFADKLDPETAKLFAQTIDNFGFNFIATMPSGAQNKILADGVNNIAYDVIAPNNQDDGKFHKNQVRPALIWTR